MTFSSVGGLALVGYKHLDERCRWDCGNTCNPLGQAALRKEREIDDEKRERRLRALPHDAREAQEEADDVLRKRAQLAAIREQRQRDIRSVGTKAERVLRFMCLPVRAARAGETRVTFADTMVSLSRVSVGIDAETAASLHQGRGGR
eukprot:gene11342-54041_t